MIITSTIKNTHNKHDVIVSTNNNSKTINIAPKSESLGSSINGGELLLTALATCFCNDIYREAAKRKMNINSVEIVASAEFGGEGDPASNIIYRANIDAPNHSQKEINDLILYVDSVAEIHNTLRKGTHLSVSM